MSVRNETLPVPRLYTEKLMVIINSSRSNTRTLKPYHIPYHSYGLPFCVRTIVPGFSH